MSVSHHSIPVAVDRQTPRDHEHPENAASEQAKSPGVCVTPPIDIHEGPNGLILEADLPGVTEDHVTIQLEDNVLNLHAQVSRSVPEGSRPIHEEYPIGDFFRSFILSDEVERSQITAELRNGVLRLTLPKAERAKTRRIEIKS